MPPTPIHPTTGHFGSPDRAFSSCFRLPALLFDGPGAGAAAGAGQAGSGGGSPTGGAGAGAGGSGGSGAGAGGTGATTPQPFALADDAMVIPPGTTTPVKWSEYRAGFIPNTEYTHRKTLLDQAEATLLRHAQDLDRRQASLRGQQQPPPDPMAEIENLAVVDGRTLASLYRTLDQQGLGPVRQMMQTMQATIKTMDERLKAVSGTVGAHANQQTEAQYYQRLDAAIKTAVPALPNIPEAAEIRELGEDIYRSHEINAELDQKFPAMLAARIDKLRKVFREMDKTEAAARVAQRRLPPQGGRITPQGGQPRFETTAEIARRAFATADSAT